MGGGLLRNKESIENDAIIEIEISAWDAQKWRNSIALNMLHAKKSIAKYDKAIELLFPNDLNGFQLHK